VEVESEDVTVPELLGPASLTLKLPLTFWTVHETNQIKSGETGGEGMLHTLLVLVSVLVFEAAPIREPVEMFGASGTGGLSAGEALCGKGEMWVEITSGRMHLRGE